MPRALPEVPGGVVGWGGGVGWLRPILVFSLSLSQAEELESNSQRENYNAYSRGAFETVSEYIFSRKSYSKIIH